LEEEELVDEEVDDNAAPSIASTTFYSTVREVNFILFFSAVLTYTCFLCG
jgi:hypothetical protein